MTDIIKNEMTAEKMAHGMYELFIDSTIKEPLCDHDESIILDKGEQALLFLSHLCDLLSNRNLNVVKAELLSVFTRAQRKTKDEGDYWAEMLLVTNSAENISYFFKHLPPDQLDFAKLDWVFDRKLNIIQKTLVLLWYTQRLKAIDKTFKEIIDKASSV